MNLRDLLSDRIDFKNLTFILYRKNRSQCGYWEKERQLPAIDEGLENETRLYTTNGINVLRVGLHVSDETVVNAFAIITDYSSTGLTAKVEPIHGIFGYSNWDSDHRGVRFKIANANLVSAH